MFERDSILLDAPEHTLQVPAPVVATQGHLTNNSIHLLPNNVKAKIFKIYDKYIPIDSK